MDQRQTQSQYFVSNAKENFCTIDGKRYATGENGLGLYELIDPAIAYFPDEAVLIDSDFSLNAGDDLIMAVKAAVLRASKADQD